MQLADEEVTVQLLQVKVKGEWVTTSLKEQFVHKKQTICHHIKNETSRKWATDQQLLQYFITGRLT